MRGLRKIKEATAKFERLVEGLSATRRPSDLTRDRSPSLVNSSFRPTKEGDVLATSRPSEPSDNWFIEGSNGKFPAERLETHDFMSIEEVLAIDVTP